MVFSRRLVPGLPPLTYIYDGFLQLHVEGSDGKTAAVKRDAEAALLAHFKSPLYLVEKPFFHATGINDEEDDGVVADALIVPPTLATGAHSISQTREAT